jgi:transcriptional regulator with XRE-family HTH domain
MRNLAVAMARRPRGYPRPWRCFREMHLIRRLAYQWWKRPDCSQREVARRLGISHTQVQRLVRKFKANPAGAERVEHNLGPATFDALRLAKAVTEEWRAKGWLRPRRLARRRIEKEILRRIRGRDPRSAALEKRIRDWLRDHPQNR